MSLYSAVDYESGLSSRRGCWLLIVGRAAAAITIFLIGLGFSIINSPQQSGQATLSLSRGVQVLVMTTLILTVVYALLLRLTKIPVKFQTALQLGVDCLLATWLVLVTGDLRSPYVAFYIALISVASIVQGSRGALVTSVASAVAYVAAMVARLYEVKIINNAVLSGAVTTAQTSTADAVQVIGLNTIAFFVVALLAARLAERQTRTVEATNALARLRALHERIVESIRSGVVTTDLKGNIFTFNHAAEEMTGYHALQMRGQHASRLFADFDAHLNESLQAAASGERSPRYETECLTPEGLAVRLGFSIFPLSAEGGERSGYVITFQDLTELRSLEEAARRQDRLAAVGRVAAGIAHEIRNPLASISGSVQVLKSETSPDIMQAELMDIILRESQRLNRIITDYLAYARPRAVELTETDLRAPLREVFTLLRHSPELHPAHTLEVMTDDAPVNALVDVDSFKQVFNNLARNALKAMPDGGKLQAVVRRNTQQQRAQIIFTDEGCGMSSKQVERLFEPFSSSTTGGTGLGLSIVYQIIRDHSGTINVRSQEAAGTTITIELASRG